MVLFLFFLKETLFVDLSKVTHVSGIKNASRGIFLNKPQKEEMIIRLPERCKKTIKQNDS